MRSLTHGRITLALHELKTAGSAEGGPSNGDHRPLLHLHGLGLRSPDVLPLDLESWPGPVYALDFTGHGASTAPKGGGYTPELLMGDVDAAIQELGEVTLIGNGLGGYIALLTAASRVDAVRGAIICDGPGLSGGGPAPGTPTISRVDLNAPTPPDPFAMAELSKDIRPPYYAVDFVNLILVNSKRPDPIAVCAKARPEWLEAVLEELGASPVTQDDALARYAAR